MEKGTKSKISEREKKQVELVIKCAEMIKSSIRMSAIMQDGAHMQPQDIFTSMTLAIGDTIVEMSTSTRNRKEILTAFTEALNDYVMEADNKEKGD